MTVYEPGHRGVIEPSRSDNATLCSSALLPPGESSSRRTRGGAGQEALSIWACETCHLVVSDKWNASKANCMHGFYWKRPVFALAHCRDRSRQRCWARICSSHPIYSFVSGTNPPFFSFFFFKNYVQSSCVHVQSDVCVFICFVFLELTVQSRITVIWDMGVLLLTICRAKMDVLQCPEHCWLWPQVTGLTAD